MANRGEEVQLLGPGIQANAPSRGAFAHNMLYHNNCWQVRRGFGQVTQFDAQMAAPSPGAATVWGMRKHLGSGLIKTNFGNLQMLSVFIADVNTSAVGGLTTSSVHLPIYIVSIYDLSTNERFEVPLYPHTSQAAVSQSYKDTAPTSVGAGLRTVVDVATPVDDLTPQYQTNANDDVSAWIKADDEFFFFEEFNDILYFGNATAGTWAYIPASFNSIRPTTIDRVNQSEYAQAYGESSMITPVVLSPGVNTEAFDYLRTADMPNAVDVAVVQNRMVYASGRTVFWTDPGFPNAITANNFFAVPSEEQITAVAELNSNLIIFTPNETWMYQPSIGAVVSQGRLTKTSDTIGCIGPNAVCKVEGSLAWIDSSGAYTTSSGLELSAMSDDILPFFERQGINNPMTSYFVATGHTALTGEQPLTTMRLDPEGVKCVFLPTEKLFIVTLPKLNGSLVLSSGRWAWWSYESMVAESGGVAVVGVTQNIPAPWVLAHQDTLFAIAGPDVQKLTDGAATEDNTQIDDDTTSRSFFILEYGRGGAIDRSVTDEDDRKLTGSGVARFPSGAPASENASDGGVFFGDPIAVPVGYVFPSGVTTATTDDFILIPVSVVPPQDVWDPSSGEGIDEIDIKLSFDDDQWRPVYNHATNGDIEVLVPPERLASAAGWVDLATYTDATFGTKAQDRGFLRMKWAGAGLGSWIHAPQMNLNFGRHNRLIYLPFKKFGTADTSQMGWRLLDDGLSPPNTLAFLVDRAATPDILRRVGFHVFNRWRPGSSTPRENDSVAQPVDWAYKSTNVGLEGDVGQKMRGTWANVLSHGTGDDKVNDNWPYGLFNTLAGSDRKEWITQIIDVSPREAAVEQQDAVAPFASKSTIRTRVQASSGALVDKVFQAGGATDVAWGDPSTPATGNMLIGDEDTSDISVSMSVKGRSFSVMHFGFIMNRAERLMVEGVKALVRMVGGRRRRGR